MDPYAFVPQLGNSRRWKFDSLFCGTPWVARSCKGVFNTLCRWKDEPDIYSGRWCVRGNRRSAQLRISGSTRPLTTKLRDKCRSSGKTTDFLRVVDCLTVTFIDVQMQETSYTTWISTSQVQHNTGSGRRRGHGLGRGRGRGRLSTSGCGNEQWEGEADDNAEEEEYLLSQP